MADVIPENGKNLARKALSDFFRNANEGMFCTLIVTTDGHSWRIHDSAYPLPDRYLKEWERDARRLDVDLSLGEDQTS